MKFNVVNKELNVGAVKVISISASSVFLVGDTQTIHCSSMYELWEDMKEDLNGDTAANTIDISRVRVQEKR